MSREPERGERAAPEPAVDRSLDLVVRLATVAEIAAMQRIEVDAGRRFARIGMHEIANDPPPDAAVLAMHIETRTAWVAVVDDPAAGPAGRVLGYALASVVDGEAHLDQVSVADDAGGRGIGTALIEQVCTWAGRTDVGVVHHSVTLTTFADVAWNAPMYARLGFEELDDLGPELAAIRAAEVAHGFDRLGRRLAMRRILAT